MSLQKKLLASAIIAGLAISATAQAAINLGDAPLVYASEIDNGTTLTDPDDDVTFDIGYNFSSGEVRYGRYECTGNMTLDNVGLTETGGNVALGSINGEGTSALFFSMTGNGTASADDSIAVDADNTLEDGGDVQCAFSIYDQPSEAQAGGATGQIYTTGFETVITRESGFVFAMDPEESHAAVADVESEAGAYFDFEGTHHFANLSFLAAEGVLDADGASIALSDIFGAGTVIRLDGDFSAADPFCQADWEGDSDLCPDDADDDGLIFEIGSTEQSGVFHFEPTDEDPIQVSEYVATLLADANEGYTVADVGPIHVGDITRNGTQLQAPLAQVPGAGWLSRMVLTNTGSVDRPYEISVMGETGNTIGTGNTTGFVPANGTVVVDLATVMTSFTAGQQRRGTLNVTVAAPNNQIQGLYQIVNTTSGSLSNHVMVRPFEVEEDEGP